MKELKSIDIASYTIISTGIATLFAILISIILGAAILFFVPGSFSPMIFIVSTIIFGTIVCSIFLYFSQGYLYNALSSGLRYIKLDIDESGYIKKISTKETALIIGAITFSMLVVLYFAFSLILPLILNSFVSILMYASQLVLAFMVYQFIYIISNPINVLIGIIAMTIITSVLILISTYIYNLLAGSERGIIVDLSKEDKFTVLESIDYKSFAIALATINLVINIIVGIIMIISGNEIFSTLSGVLIGFFASFIEAVLFAAFYNYLAPKLGKLKFELE